MLARLQQAVVLVGLMAAAGLAGLAWAGHPLGALAGAVCLCSGHALVLGLEFWLLGRVHGDDPAPRASAAQRWRAWWAESLTAPRVFCWRQPFRSHRWPDHLPEPAPLAGQAPRPGVLLVHGFVCNRGLWNDWLARLQAAGVPFIAVNLTPVFGSIDDYPPHIEAAVRRLEALTGAAPIAVAHSMGGLALRAWWAQAGNAKRLAHAFTLGTPHHGTWLARWGLSPNARQMRQSSPWLKALAAREAELAAQGQADLAARCTCFYSHADNIVFPASTATLPGADNRHLPATAHVHMVAHPAPWAALAERLGLPAAA